MAIQLTITWRRLVAALVSAVVLALAGYGLADLVRPQRSSSLTSSVDRARFQAVVLSSGVIYFGHLRVADHGFYELRDAYYIQEVKKAGAEPSRQVVPLTQELHGPENRMLIPREHVVSVENLRPDSPVAKAAASPAP
jgi:hypothetical protein